LSAKRPADSLPSKQYRERVKQKAEKASGERPIATAWLSYCVDQVRDRDTLIVNDHGVSQEHLSLSEPASYFGGSPAGGLGWGIGGALGMKLAHPEKTVIASVGDGTYMFNNPTACHFVSQAYDLPMLTIVCNNAIALHQGRDPTSHARRLGGKHGKLSPV
jgi:acetolactate synthase-1/2/3 large subunit